MYVLYFTLYVFVCGCVSCIFKFFNLGITYKKIPKKYVGKKTPIYSIVKNDIYPYCIITKYELLFSDKDSWFSLIIPFHITCSKLDYFETFSTNSIVELFKDKNNKELGKKSYEELVNDCENQLREYKNRQIIEYREKKSLEDLNKTFTENYFGN